MGGRPAGSAALQWPEPKPEPRGAARAKRPPDLFENQGAACAAARLMALCSGPWMNARLFCSVWAMLGANASFNNAAIAPCACKSLANTGAPSVL